jgi:hypothetical protein
MPQMWQYKDVQNRKKSVENVSGKRYR